MRSNHLPKLGLIGTVGVPAKYGGFETLVHHLVLNLNDQFDMTVYASKLEYSEEEQVEEWEGAKIKYMPFKANGFQSVLYDFFSIIHAIKRNDFLLILGVSAGLFFPFFKLFSNKKIIVNIDGLEWRRPKWNWFAKMFLLVSEMVACRFADEIVTDNRILKEYVKIRYNRVGELIEYGADHTKPRKIHPDHCHKFPFLEKKYAFKVARIEPENNIHTILEAFSEKPDLPIAIVGNWDASNYGKKLRKLYANHNNIYLLDPIYEIKMLDVLRSNCYVYIHGHSAGGTNPSLVEAMYLKIPVIAIDVLFNRVTTNNQAIYFSNEKDLLLVLNSLHRYPLLAVANNLKEIADQQYTWKNISNRYARIINDQIDESIDLKDFTPIKIKKALQLEKIN